MSDVRLDGRVAVVTGAGGGLGKAHALLLAARGAKVVVNDLGGSLDGSGGSSSMADQVVAEIREAGGEAVANYDSVATVEGGEGIIRSAIEAFGTIDIVVNNAGILRDKSFVKMTPAMIEAVIDVHLKGAFYVTAPAFKVMREKGYGRIVFTTSSAGLFGNFGQANYGAAKMGLVGLSAVLAIEGLKYGIQSNVIAPIARTRMTESMLGPLADALGPEEVAPVVAYLCSEASSVTHEVFSVGGGRVARVFVGLCQGWRPDGGGLTPESVAANLEKIMDPTDYMTPGQATQEIAVLAKMIG